MSNPKTLKFPEDEQGHPFTIEWWYFNGHVFDEEGNKYSCMHCLFKVNAHKVDFPGLKYASREYIYFAHSLITDHRAKKFISDVDHISVVSKDSFRDDLINIEYVNPSEVMREYTVSRILETKPLDFMINNQLMRLELEHQKKPMLEQENGWVEPYKETGGSYYYTLSRLKTKGILKMGGKRVPVKGKSWMDHQWSNTRFNAHVNWTWFSVQLDNDVDIVVAKIGLEGKEPKYFATIMHADQTQQSFREMTLTPGDVKWTSPVTKAEYTLSWNLEIAEAGVVLYMKPVVEDQEMLFGLVHYWEGPIKVSGTYKGEKVTGDGFQELVGYHKHISNAELLSKEFVDEIKSLFAKE
jgi:predicted secreted hydrolase